MQNNLAAIDTAGAHGQQPAGMLLYAGIIEGFYERWPDAVDRFRLAVEADPAFAKAFLYLGRSLTESGQFDEARTAFTEAEALGVPADALADARRRLASVESSSARTPG